MRSDQEKLNDWEISTGANRGVSFDYVMAVRGGWGCAKLLDLQGQDEWLKCPLVGFSDCSTLLWAAASLYKVSGIHGPTLTTLVDEPLWSQQRLLRALARQSLPVIKGQSCGFGMATGPLWVGNLTVVTHLIGTKYFPDLTNSILVFEDVNEPLYKVDRMLTHWRLSGHLNKISGLGMGRFSGKPEWHQKSEFNELMSRLSSELSIPVVIDLPIGHGIQGNAALPLLAEASIDGQEGTLAVK
jgi:muramoyltetrapeptide carboxypeptidase